MKRFWLLTVLVLLLAACGGAAQEATLPEEGLGDAPLALSDTVDVETVAGSATTCWCSTCASSGNTTRGTSPA